MSNLKLRLFFIALCAIAATIFSCSTCKMEDDLPANCPDCPVITALTPNFGSPGDTITLSGKNFGGLQEVQFGTAEAEVLDGATATSIQVIAPDLNKTGAVDVIVVRNFQSPSGGTAVLSSEAVAFTYAPEKATIASLTPNTGSAGTLVTILGQRFDNLKAVRFNGVDATIQSQTPTQLTVLAPTVSVTGPVGVAVVTQFDLNGTLKENPSAPASFTYEGNFGILDFSPKIGKKDDLVTISGFGFGTNPAAIQVEFNGKAAEVMSVTDTEIKAKVPVRAGDGSIRITRASQSVLSTEVFIYVQTYTVSTPFNLSGEPRDIDFFNGRIIATNGSTLYSIENNLVTEIFLTSGHVELGGGFRPNGNYMVISSSPTNMSEIKPGSNVPTLFSNITNAYLPTDIEWLDNNRMLVISPPTSWNFTKLSLCEINNNFLNTDWVKDFVPFSNGAIPVGGEPVCMKVKDNDVYFSDANSLIRKISGNIVTNITGQVGVFDHLDGTLVQAKFNDISGIVLDDTGLIYVVDKKNNCIRRIDIQGNKVTTIAGNSLLFGKTDGDGSIAKFASPHGLAIDNDGNLLVSDTKNKSIRKITIE